jgi:hypothetical protein
VQWYIYNTSTASYVAVSDLTVFKKMASQIAISVSIGNGNGVDDKRAVVGRTEGNDLTIAWADKTLAASLPAQYQLPFGTQWGEANKIGAIMVSYSVGTSTYNFSLHYLPALLPKHSEARP